jgi:DNA invertase Pin-like site-specific DNA recombinase
MKRVALYARVSTVSQTTENQLLELRQTAQRMGYTIVAEFVDNGISGAKGRADRPALDQMLKQAAQRKFDMILCWDISRLGRSLQNLVEILTDLQSMKTDLFFQQQGLDTSTSSGRMIFGIFGALAEYERELIRERVIAGQQRAKSQGIKLGRPSKMNEGLKTAIKLLREKGMGIKQIAMQCQVGVGTVYTALA